MPQVLCRANLSYLQYQHFGAGNQGICALNGGSDISVSLPAIFHQQAQFQRMRHAITNQPLPYQGGFFVFILVIENRCFNCQCPFFTRSVSSVSSGRSTFISSSSFLLGVFFWATADKIINSTEATVDSIGFISQIMTNKRKITPRRMKGSP